MFDFLVGLAGAILITTLILMFIDGIKGVINWLWGKIK